MKKIKILSEESLAVALWNAMSKTSGDIMQKFKLEPKGDDTEVDVTILVNGVEVDLLGELIEFVKYVEKTFDNQIHEEAVELLSINKELNSLYEMSYEIENLKYKLRERVQNITKDVE